MRRGVLVIARLDRLARNVALIADLMADEFEFVAVDFPTASRLTLHILAAIAEYESKLMSERTKAALAAAEARGVRAGGPLCGFADPRAAIAASVKHVSERALAHALDVAPIVWGQLARGKSQNEIAAELNRQGPQTPRKCAWDGEGMGRVMRLTKNALPVLAGAAAARPDWRAVQARGVTEALAPLVWSLRGDGLSQPAIAGELNRRAIPAPGGGLWRSWSVFRVLRATKEFVPQAEAINAAASGRWVSHAHRRALGLAPLVMELRGQGLTLYAIAQEFNKRGIRSANSRPCGGGCVRQILFLAEKVNAERTGAAPRTPFRSPPLDPPRLQSARHLPTMWRLPRYTFDK